MNREKEEFNIDNMDLEIEVPELNLGELDEILNEGVKPKLTFFAYLRNAFKELGFNNIFHDKTELGIILLSGIFVLFFSMTSLNNREVGSLYKFIFISSPILYLSVILFSFYNSKTKGVFQLEMTCKYNLYQLSALRMFIFSLGSILINTIVIVFMSILNKDLNALRLIILSVTGLFLFSTVFIYALMRFKSVFSKAFIIVGWILGNLLLSFGNEKYYLEFLMEVPIYVHIVISIVCIFLYVKNLKELINYRYKKRREILC